MALSLHTLTPNASTKKSRKRIGRGGKRGTYSGRGLKGQKARSGSSGLKRKGMRQLVERTHKLRGFKSIHPKPATVSLGVLNKVFKDGDKVTPQSIFKHHLVESTRAGIKILSNGEIKIKITVSGCSLSQTAKTAIEKAGGKVLLKTQSSVTNKQPGTTSHQDKKIKLNNIL